MPLKYPTTSRTLLDKLASGDEISWDEFFIRYSPIVKAIAIFKGLSESDADDICQQVMTQFFQQSRRFKFDPGIARFRTYFGRIVRSRIADFYRRKREIPVAEFEPLPVEPETERLFMDEWRRMVLNEAEMQLRELVTPEHFKRISCSPCRSGRWRRSPPI